MRIVTEMYEFIMPSLRTDPRISFVKVHNWITSLRAVEATLEDVVIALFVRSFPSELADYRDVLMNSPEDHMNLRNVEEYCSRKWELRRGRASGGADTSRPHPSTVKNKQRQVALVAELIELGVDMELVKDSDNITELAAVVHPGLRAQQLAQVQQKRAALEAQKQCFLCKQFGHVVASCPQKVNVSEAAVARAREQEANAVLEEHLGVKSLTSWRATFRGGQLCA